MSCNVIATEDSNFIFVNYLQDSATGRQDAGFITVDKLGNEISHNSFNYSNSTWNTFFNRKHFIQVSGASFFLSGGDPNGNAMACKISKNSLDTLKTLKLQSPNYSFYMNNFVKIRDNKFFWIGNSSDASGLSGTLIVELDSTLNIVSQSTICVSSTFGNHSVVKNTLTSQLMFAGKSYYPAEYLNTQTLTDTLGTTLTNSTSVSSLTTNVVQVYFSAIDTSYVCIGGMVTAKYNTWGLKKLCISKYDQNLKLLWQKTYGQNAIYNSLDKAVILPDGSIVASGGYSNLSTLPLTNADNNGVIIKVDKDGHFRWMREYSHFGPGNYVEGFYGLDRTLDGGFILCGSVQNLPHAKAWAVKTDSMGCVTPGCTSSTVTVDSLIIPKDTSIAVGINKWLIGDSEFNVYPNPAKDEFTIDCISDETYLVILSDVQGKELERVAFSHKGNISIANLSSGVYWLKVYGNGQPLRTKKVVVIK